MDLREYQASAADFIYSLDQSLLLAPVGAGKTAAALVGIRDLIRDGVLRRVLVLAPLRVCSLVWPREAAIWAPELRVAVGAGGVSARRAAIQSDAQVVVVNFDVVQQLCEGEDLSSFDGLLIDELTKLKRPGGKRFKALAKKTFKWKCGMTASFVSQGLRDVFGQVLIVDGGAALGRVRDHFEREYFYPLDPLGRRLDPKPGALDRVMEKIAPITFMLENSIHTRSLPPLVHNLVPAELSEDEMEVYKTFRDEWVLDRVAAVNDAVMVGKLTQLSSGFLYQPDGSARWYHSRKADTVMELVESLAGTPVLIAYQFQEERALLGEWLPDAPCLTELSGRRLAETVDAFNAGSVPVMLIHPASAGHGLNLQGACSNIVWMTLPWSYELFDQTIGRIYRSGQTRTVFSHVVLLDRTMDGAIWRALLSRADFDERARTVLLEGISRIVDQSAAGA